MLFLIDEELHVVGLALGIAGLTVEDFRVEVDGSDILSFLREPCTAVIPTTPQDVSYLALLPTPAINTAKLFLL